jgi:prolyl 4-hydroxylase
MIGYIFALLPLYMLVYLPLSHVLQGKQPQPTNLDISNLNTSFLALDEPLQCPPHSYTAHILSLSPLIIYIENFLSEDESAHLLRVRYSSPSTSKFSTRNFR